MTLTNHAKETLLVAAAAAADKLATDIVAFDVSEQLIITDTMMLCTGNNDRQVRAIVDEIEDQLREAGAKALHREGERDGRWVLIDYGDLIVHVMHTAEREYYALERLWGDCPMVPLPDTITTGRD